MPVRFRWISICVVASLLVAFMMTVLTTPTMAQVGWSIRPQEKIVLLGNTFMERENHFGKIELSLQLTHPQRELSVRNLGWSGDNVLGESRAYFGPVSAGSAHLREYVKLLKPTTILLSYGQNVAFEGRSALQPFLQKYAKLIDDLSAENRQLVVLGLTPLEAVHRDADTTARLNADRVFFNEQIQQLCDSKRVVFIDLFDPLLALQRQQRLAALTENGVHLRPEGYVLVGEIILNSLDQSLLKNNESLLLDSQFQAVSEPLAEAIDWKNELFFHRFRPQNETYLRGFRKHEQGQNAKEIYEFDELIKQADAAINPLVKSLSGDWVSDN